MDGKTKIYGLIGNPVEHSMSPLMQNFYAGRTGVNLAYVPFHVENDRLGDAIKGALALNIQGLNVTVPHKQRVMEYIADIDEDAKAIGAVNTLVPIEQGYRGYNTDGFGFWRTLDEAGIAVENQDCILIGAGGAAKAAAYELAKGKARVIYILNRSIARAQELADYINGLMGRAVMIPLALADYGQLPQKEKGYLAIQSTSVGMHPHTEAVVIEDEAFYRLIHTAMDIVYTPADTRFMKMTRAAGGRAINGLDMLLYQGIASYELWNPGIHVDKETIDIARQMIQRQLDHKKNVIIIGFMGAGKTSVGDSYAKTYHLPVIDTDQEIEAAAGMAISDIFAQKGEEAFRRLETGVLEELLKRPSGAVISVGGGLPLREENRRLLKKLGTVIYLDVSPETVFARIGADVSDRPMLHGDDVMGRIRELLDYRKPFYLEASHASVDVNGRSLEAIVAEIHQRVEEG